MNLGDIKTERVHDADKLSVLGYEIQPNQTKVKSHDVPLKECIGENRQRKIRNAGMGWQANGRMKIGNGGMDVKTNGQKNISNDGMDR